MNFSSRVLNIKPSETLKAKQKTLELKAKGMDVIDFSAGEPPFPTPEKIKSACKRALDENFTRYGPVNGLLELRQAIAQKLKRTNDINLDPDQIVVTCGAKQAIFSALQILVNPGEEVLLPVPYWVTYPAHILLAEGKTVFLPTEESTEFRITPAQLQKAITVKTKLLILNTPSNPTGSCYTEKELKELGKILAGKNIWVLSDEIYDEITYEGFKHVSFLKACPELKEKTILVNGASKTYAMTGWRVGFAAGPKPFIEKLKILQGQEITSIPTFIQRASIAAFQDCDVEVAAMREAFEKRRNKMEEGLRQIPKLKFLKPMGAFYFFPDFSVYQKPGLDLADTLLEEAHVSVVPGKGFGAPKHLRLSFTAERTEIEEGLDRIKRTMEKLK